MWFKVVSDQKLLEIWKLNWVSIEKGKCVECSQIRKLKINENSEYDNHKLCYTCYMSLNWISE